MAWDDIVAALTGALGGGLDAWGLQRRQKQADEERAREQQRRDEEQEWRREQRDQQRADAADRALDRERGFLRDKRAAGGAGAEVSAEDAARFRAADLGEMLDEDQEFQSSIFAGSGGMPGLEGAPTMAGLPEMRTRTTFTPTAAERAKVDAARAEQQRQARARVMLPPHLQPLFDVGQATGKMPTFSPHDMPTPEERQQREIDAAVEKEKALVPVRLRQRAGEKAIDRRYADVPAPLKDDPAMPMGVRKYIGDTIAKYQADPNGAAAARAEIQSAMPQLLQDHPRLDVTEVMKQLGAGLPLPTLTDDEKDAAAVRRATPPAPLPMTPDQQRPPQTLPATPGKLPVPVPLAGGRRPGQPAQQVLPNQPPAAPARGPQPGQRVRLKSGQVVTVSRVNPDGTFEYQ